MTKTSLHGGNVYEIAREYGIDPWNIVDFSASINPLGMSGYLKKLLHEGIDDLVNYPDTECSELRSEISRYLDVPEDMIAAGNGASEMIQLVFEELKPQKLYMPAPCFLEYQHAGDRFGVRIEYYQLLEGHAFRLDVEDFIQKMPEDTDTVLICNPNNPTGTLVSTADMEKLLAFAHAQNIRVVLDEAFIELTEGSNANSMVKRLTQYPNLFIIRSLTKILAIPGLRLGYVLGEPTTIQKMMENKIKWSVNALACNIGSVFSEDRAYFDVTAKWLSEEKERLYCALKSISGLKVFRPETNFILIKILDERHTASSLRERLILKGLLIRDASNFRFLDEKFIRVAVRLESENNRLVTALSEILG